MLSKVVFFGFPGHGHINPTLGVVKELIARGEEVIYFCTSEYKFKIVGTGAKYRRYRIPLLAKNWIDNKVDFKSLNQMGKEAIRRMSLYFKIMGNRHWDLKKEVMKIKPDYVIHDSCASWGKYIAVQLGLPAICSVTTFAYCDRVLEFHPDFVFQRMMRIPAQYVFNPREAQKIIQRFSKMMASLFKIPDYNFFDLAYSHEQCNIVFSSKEFQCFGELFGDSFIFVGPSFELRKEPGSFPWERLAGKSLIYISLGTVENRNPSYPDFYRKCFKAFENSGRQVVMAVGDISIRKLGKIPENFIVRRWVPQLEILKRADLFITHGGMNSAMEAIYFNVPMIVIPQRVDQFQVAWRVADLRLGVEFENMEFTFHELQAAANELLTNESYRQSSQRIKESFITAGGYKRAVAEIIKFKSNYGVE